MAPADIQSFAHEAYAVQISKNSNIATKLNLMLSIANIVRMALSVAATLAVSVVYRSLCSQASHQLRREKKKSTLPNWFLTTAGSVRPLTLFLYRALIAILDIDWDQPVHRAKLSGELVSIQKLAHKTSVAIAWTGIARAH